MRWSECLSAGLPVVEAVTQADEAAVDADRAEKAVRVASERLEHHVAAP